MPTTEYTTRTPNEWLTSAEALRGRIDRRLRKLFPYREFIYEHKVGGWYVQIVDNSTQHMSRQGPYYYRHLSGLARMIGLFRDRKGNDFPSVTCKAKGKEYPEEPLPPELRFNVLSLARANMIRELEEAGWKCTMVQNVTLNNSMHPSRAPVKPDPNDPPLAPITAPVTEELNPGLFMDHEATYEEEYVEMTEEQLRIARGY
jgi:hypothetical protein